MRNAIVLLFAVAVAGCSSRNRETAAPVESAITLAEPSGWRPHQQVLDAAMAVATLDLPQTAAIGRVSDDCTEAFRKLVRANDNLQAALMSLAGDAALSKESFAQEINAIGLAARNAGEHWTRAIADVHRTLTPPQRQTVAAALERWAQIPREQRTRRAGQRRATRGAAAERDRLVESLHFTPSQRELLDAKVATPERRRSERGKRSAAVLEFADPGFDPAVLRLPERMQRRARAVATQRVLILLAIRSVLRAEQVDLLARDLRQAPLAE